MTGTRRSDDRDVCVEAGRIRQTGVRQDIAPTEVQDQIAASDHPHGW